MCVIGSNPLHTTWLIVDIADITVVQYDVFPVSIVIPDDLTAICSALFSNVMLVVLLLKRVLPSRLRFPETNIMVIILCPFGKSLARILSIGP